MNKTSIGSRIREIRRRASLTQRDFGERLGVAGGYVSAIEHDNNPPSDLLIKAICREFGVYEDWLRTGKGPMLREDLHLTEDLEAEVMRRVREREVEGLAGILKETASGYQAGLRDDQRELLNNYEKLSDAEKELARQVIKKAAERRREE
jgi:transcriptional regulator with XRE-family HTH domain